MAQNKILNIPDAYIATAGMTTACNLLNCTVTTLAAGAVGFTGTQPYIILKHIRVNNQLTTSAINVTLYKGASLNTASGTQFALSSVSIPAQSYIDWYGQARFDTADYLSGLASLPVSAIINMDGEIGLS
jgi:hypothetical protein